MTTAQVEKVLVSVIVPVYNIELYIVKALKSIVAQNFTNFEIIIVDDGSTDNSYQLARDYLSTCNTKNKIIRQQNSGVSAARNVGLENATGEYVVFVDGDDLISPYYISKMYSHMTSDEIQTVICGFQVFTDATSPLDGPFIGKAFQEFESINLMYDFLAGKTKIALWTMMVKRALIAKHNIQFAMGYKYSEDIHFVWKVLAHSNKVLLDHSQLYYYRVRSGSAMAQFGDSRLDGMHLMEDLELYFKNHCMKFADDFTRHGVARWVWATSWQAACSLKYSEFNEFCNKAGATSTMVRLWDFPDIRVRLSAKLFITNQHAYYLTARIIASIRRVNRFKIV